MKNTLFKKVLAVALACTMTFSMATVTHAADAKEITIGVTSFADTLEPTEQYFSWVVSRYAIGECLTKFDENGEIVPCLAESWENSEDGKISFSCRHLLSSVLLVLHLLLPLFHKN